MLKGPAALDAEHKLDIGLGNPIAYAGCGIELGKDKTGKTRYILVNSPANLAHIVRNLKAMLEAMPTDYIWITGVCPRWVHAIACYFAKEYAKVVHTHDGTNVIELPRVRPRCSWRTVSHAIRTCFMRRR